MKEKPKLNGHKLISYHSFRSNVKKRFYGFENAKSPFCRNFIKGIFVTVLLFLFNLDKVEFSQSNKKKRGGLKATPFSENESTKPLSFNNVGFYGIEGSYQTNMRMVL